MNWDYTMAEGIRKSFVKAVVNQSVSWCKFNRSSSVWNKDFFKRHYELAKDKLHYLEKGKREGNLYDENIITILDVINTNRDDQACAIYELACNEVEEETHQAMEAAIHNFCTLSSRAGSQIPFSSINFGTDTTPEGRLAIRETLRAIENGLGHHEIALFPISVFRILKGINYEPGDPNYDLFKYVCKVSAKRLYPNFLNCSASYNIKYYKPGNPATLAATMGKRKLSPSV